MENSFLELGLYFLTLRSYSPPRAGFLHPKHSAYPSGRQAAPLVDHRWAGQLAREQDLALYADLWALGAWRRPP